MAQQRTADWRALVKRAEAGDRRVLPALRACFDNDPEVWQTAGDLAWQTQQSLIQAMSGDDNVSLPEIYRRKLPQMRQELGWEAASPVERLLIDRVVTTWLHVHYLELVYVQNLAAIPLQAHDAYQRRISRAHARYLSAVRELLRARTLLVTVVLPRRPREALPRAVLPMASPEPMGGHDTP